jgi:hypothetical protein
MLIDRKSLAAVKASTNTPDGYSLDGILLDQNGTVAATDRHVLLVVEGTKDDAKDFPEVTEAANPPAAGVMIPSALVKDVMKALPKKTIMPIQQNAVMVECDGEVAFVTVDGDRRRREAMKPLDGTFPRYKRMIANNLQVKGRKRVRISLTYLRRLLDAIAGMIDGRDDGIDILVGGAKETVAVRFAVDGNRRGVALIAPMDSRGAVKLTDWELGLISAGEAEPEEKPPEPVAEEAGHEEVTEPAAASA